MKQTEEKSWHEFYRDRVNSSYQDYFEERYKPLIDCVLDFKPQMVREEGIGIGSLSKALQKQDIFTYGFDNSIDMLALCQKNVPGIFVYQDNIHKPEYKDEGKDLYSDLVVTMGVLEHFTDTQILLLNVRYKEIRQKRVHYVPLEGYKTPSFGDERLLSKDHWLKLLKPKDFILFNDDCDLLLIN